VYNYAEPIVAHGFVFMDTPGYDPVAVTGQIAGGCNILCFTTGRGSTTGYKPVPCIKLASNTQMYQAMAEDMDLDCGGIVSGEASIAQVGEAIFAKILAVASGERTFSEQYGYGKEARDEDFRSFCQQPRAGRNPQCGAGDLRPVRRRLLGRKGPHPSFS
jgi:galactarate dehydratase